MPTTFRIWKPGAFGLLLAVHAASAQPASSHASPAPLLTVEWGATTDSVMARAGRSGWTFSKVDADGDFVFEGQVNAVAAVAFATFSTTGGLTRVLISIAPHPFAPVTYRTLTDTLRSRHGQARLGDQEPRDLPAPALHAAAAWPGILMGLRRDGWITLVFTCPETSPKLPPLRGPPIA